MTDVGNYMVSSPANRYSVGGGSGLVPNAGGSMDIYVRNTAPAGHESNWLPALSGDGELWLRVYLPGAAILDGQYNVPPVVEVKGGAYEIQTTGLGWKGQVPSGMTQISSPNNSVLVMGRVLGESDSDLPTAYDLSKQIQLTPLGGWQTSR